MNDLRLNAYRDRSGRTRTAREMADLICSTLPTTFGPYHGASVLRVGSRTIDAIQAPQPHIEDNYRLVSGLFGRSNKMVGRAIEMCHRHFHHPTISGPVMKHNIGCRQRKWRHRKRFTRAGAYELLCLAVWIDLYPRIRAFLNRKPVSRDH